MSCEELQQALSLYVDDRLALSLRAGVDEHLDHCPVCRARVAEARSVIRGLMSLERPVPPPEMTASINYALMIEAAARERRPPIDLRLRLLRWLRPRLMPYTVGSLASIILFTGLLAALVPQLRLLHDLGVASRAANQARLQSLYVVGNPESGGYNIFRVISAEDYAAERAPLSSESPSLDPRGALAALTRSLAHGHGGSDDMVVVTDVFSNGNATLADVVHAPRDARMLDDFQHALRENPAFVPASFDRRPQTMRIVFVVQKVDVDDRNF